jgi:hypothetical protein
MMAEMIVCGMVLSSCCRRRWGRDAFLYTRATQSADRREMIQEAVSCLVSSVPSAGNQGDGAGPRRAGPAPAGNYCCLGGVAG